MQKLNRSTFPSKKLPVKVLQFGGGNFLRGFIDYFIDKYNYKTGSELGVSVVKVTPKGDYAEWRAQDGLYHVLTKGIKDGKLISEKHLITCISDIIHCYEEWDKFVLSAQNRAIKFIISNTTESGLQLSIMDEHIQKIPDSFPAKLTFWLHHRYNNLGKNKAPGCIIIPCELLEENGTILKNRILKQAEIWDLNNDFKKWVQDENLFCNTLVDRIVPGIHRSKLPEVWREIGYEDHLVTEGEPYHIFVIEACEIVKKKLPLHEAGLNVVFTDNLQPYRTKKVRILNGAHTALVPVAYLAGFRIVREAINNKVLNKYIIDLIDSEIIPALNIGKKETDAYVGTIIDRFSNPFIDHYLIDISLNSFSKFKTRLLPSLEFYYKQKGKIPVLIPLAFTAMILFYKGMIGAQKIELQDEKMVLEKMKELWSEAKCDKEIVKQVLEWSEFWEYDLAVAYPGLEDIMVGYLQKIKANGIKKTLFSLLEKDLY